jgi:hypothetical protein
MWFQGTWPHVRNDVSNLAVIQWLLMGIFRCLPGPDGTDTEQTTLERCVAADLHTMSSPGQDSTTAMLVRAGFIVVLVPVNVAGFCSILAREWHGCFIHLESTR